MRKAKYVFLHSIYESKNHKTFLLSFFVAILFVTILGIQVDLVWENGQIVQSKNSIWFGGEEDDYRLGILFAYFSILLFAIFFNAGIVHQSLKNKYLSLWLIKPISRKAFASYLILTTTMLVWLIFLCLHIGLWLCMGMRYGMWMGGFWSSLAAILILCLILNSITFFFSLIAKRATSAAFLVLFFVILIPLCIPILKNNFNLTEGFGSTFIYLLNVLSPELIENFSEVSKIIFGTSPEQNHISKTLMAGAITFLGGIYLFENKSV